MEHKYEVQLCSWGPGKGWVWGRLDGPEWDLSVRTLVNNALYELPEPRVFVGLALLLITDGAIAILSFLLLRQLRIYNQRRQAAGARRHGQDVEQREADAQTQKTKVLLSLCLLILAQLVWVLIDVGCWEGPATLRQALQVGSEQMQDVDWGQSAFPECWDELPATGPNHGSHFLLQTRLQLHRFPSAQSRIPGHFPWIRTCETPALTQLPTLAKTTRKAEVTLPYIFPVLTPIICLLQISRKTLVLRKPHNMFEYIRNRCNGIG